MDSPQFWAMTQDKLNPWQKTHNKDGPAEFIFEIEKDIREVWD